MAECRDWQKAQYPAVFKGVPFEVHRDEMEGERRLAIHEYPDREFWDIEELGRGFQRVSVKGYVVGDDADAVAARLFHVCNTRGPGMLMLPFLAPTLASCAYVRRTFDDQKLGYFGFDLKFVFHAPQLGGVVPTTMLAGAASLAAATAISASASRFAAVFDTVGTPAVARDAAAVTIAAAAAALGEVAVRAGLSGRPAGTAELELRLLAQDAAALAYAGQRASVVSGLARVDEQESLAPGFAQRFDAALAGIARHGADKDGLAAALARLAMFEAQPIDIPFKAASVDAEKAMTGAVASHVRQAALATLADQTTYRTLASRAESVTERGRIAGLFAAELARVSEPGLARALTAARDAAVTWLSATGAELPPVRIFRPQRAVPAALLAWRLYGDPARGAEIVARNRLPHPLYVTEAVEVAVD